MTIKDLIPKGKYHAYQRWEMNSLEPFNAEKQEEPVVIQEQSTITLPTEEEITAIFSQAREEGYQQGKSTGYQEGNTLGFQEGKTAGYEEGRKTAEIEVKAEVLRIQALLSELEQDLEQVNQQVANDLLDLTVALTKKIVSQALKIKPELIIPIVQEAIRNLPNAAQHPRLYLHPDDAKLVLAHLDHQLKQDGWYIREDEQLTRGGCRIETSGSEVNGNLEVRWRRTIAAIGRNDEWLDK